MTEAIDGSAVSAPMPRDSETSTKRPRRRKLHPQTIRRGIREMLFAMVENDQADEKSRLEAAKFLLQLIGIRRRR